MMDTVTRADTSCTAQSAPHIKMISMLKQPIAEHLPGPTMITGVLGSLGSLNDDDSCLTDPTTLPPADVAAMVADAAPR